MSPAPPDDRPAGQSAGRIDARRRPELAHHVDFCIRQIRAIVDEIGPRPPASDAEDRCQRRVAELLRPVAEDVHQEAFRVAPRAFMGFIPISAVLLLAATASYWWSALVALLCAGVAVGLLVGELVYYREVVDPFFPHATSHNLLARLRPRGAVRQILILGGHCDSAFEWRWHYLGRSAFRVIVGVTLLGACLALGATLASVWVGGLRGPAPGTLLSGLGWVLVACSPCFLLAAAYSNFQRVSPGANDNLTGVLLSVALARYLKEAGVQLEHTEIRLLNTGSEEAGLRGARAYAQAHGDELRATPSLYVALDTFHDLDHMTIYHRDRHGTLRHHHDGADLLQTAARRAGFELPLGTIPLGATDAAAFTALGLRAIALVAMDPAPPRWYHTRLDTPDLLDPRCIEAGLRIAIELVRMVDAEGLGGERSDAAA